MLLALPVPGAVGHAVRPPAWASRWVAGWARPPLAPRDPSPGGFAGSRRMQR